LKESEGVERRTKFVGRVKVLGGGAKEARIDIEGIVGKLRRGEGESTAVSVRPPLLTDPVVDPVHPALAVPPSVLLSPPSVVQVRGKGRSNDAVEEERVSVCFEWEKDG
jgi:hypothetical protein